MQVWCLRQTGCTDITYDLALFDPLALLDGTIGEMQILGNDAVGVLDKHVVAVVLAVGRANNLTIACCKHRCALGCFVIDTVMALTRFNIG